MIAEGAKTSIWVWRAGFNGVGRTIGNSADLNGEASAFWLSLWGPREENCLWQSQRREISCRKPTSLD